MLVAKFEEETVGRQGLNRLNEIIEPWRDIGGLQTVESTNQIILQGAHLQLVRQLI